MPRIADLILAAGEARARGQRESGQIWGQTIGQIGQIAGSAVQQIPEMRAQQDAQQQEQALRALFDRPQPPSPDEIMAVVGPERGIKIAQGLKALQTDPRGDFQQTQTILRDVLLGMDSLPEPLRAEHYPLVRQRLLQRGVLKPEDAPEQYDPQWWAMTRQYGQEPETRAGFTLGEGQTRFDASGQPVANVPKPPPVEKRSFKPVTLRGPTGRPMAALFVESDGKYYKPDGKTEIPDPTPYERPREGARPTYQWAVDAQGTETLMTPDEIRSSKARRPGVASDTSMPVKYRNALDRSILSIPVIRRSAVVQTANRLWQEGNEEELKGVIRQAAIEGENVDVKNQVIGRAATLAALTDTRAILTELQKKGVPTNWFRGTAEDLARRIGKTTNPEYVALANRLMGTLINYRRAATGVQFSEHESKDYQRMFPNYKNEIPVNMALLDGLEREIRTYDKTYWEHKLGKDGAAFIIGSFGASGGEASADPLGIRGGGS